LGVFQGDFQDTLGHRQLMHGFSNLLSPGWGESTNKESGESQRGGDKKTSPFPGTGTFTPLF
jgi:hypothetical protein